MTAFEEQPRPAGPVESPGRHPREGKRPSRWAVSNWPVGWKVFAIVLVPLLIAGAFGGWRVYSDWTRTSDARQAVDRVDVVASVEKYLTALDGVLLANSTGGDEQPALSAFDVATTNLRSDLADTAVTADVRAAVSSTLTDAQALVDQVTGNGIDLRGRVSAYKPILMSAEAAVTGSVRSDDANVRTQVQGLTSALDTRGQATTQQLLVDLGGELPDQELRTSLIALAGAEPSTIPGAPPTDTQRLQEETASRKAIVSDPAAAVVGSPDLTQSLKVTGDIANQVIASTTASVTGAVADQADATRREATRDSAIVGGAMLLALLVVLVVARTLVRPLRTLRDGALRVAHEDLPHQIERVRSGGAPEPVRPLPVYTTEEVGQVAHAIDELHQQAVLLAGEQAGLQLQIGDMFETLSRRSRSLVDEQLGLIDRLERDEEDPERLQTLFELDHLVARMRRNGANLLVLAGANKPREHDAPVSIVDLINAAASEVEEYGRVVITTVPDSEVIGVLADDMVHLLAELLDNALRYSPPVSNVRVSAVPTSNGGLVIEVADSGLGMTSADLRVANTRLQSGGEVNPYTARHMGLFVVGRLAAHHGLVARLRSTTAGEPSSGTTAGVFVPVELLLHGADAPDLDAPELEDVDGYRSDWAAIEPTFYDYDSEGDYDADEGAVDEYRNGNAGVPISLLPQRDPGASGISNIPSAPTNPTARDEPDDWPADAGARPPTAGESPRWHLPVESSERPVPTDTSSFFAAKAQSTQGNGVTNGAQRPQVASEPASEPAATPAATPSAARTPSEAKGGSIFETMLSEWLIDDPAELAKSSDLDWQTVWDQGWSAAAAAEEEPVSERTEQGLPVRLPGARLVPGAAGAETRRGGRNGGDHPGPEEADQHAEVDDVDDSTSDTGPIPILRDPDAVRASIGSHFDGVRAGRSHARGGGETDHG